MCSGISTAIGETYMAAKQHLPIIFYLALFLLNCSAPGNASGTFYLRFDQFENYEGLLSSHHRCDGGRPCDPKFTVSVQGSWGEDSKASDCIVDKNKIDFGSTIGTTLPNPLTYPMSVITLPIRIDIRVKDCFLLSDAGDDIADFFETLTDLPQPVLFGELFDASSGSEKVRRLELPSLEPAPVSIKMRVSVWHQCDRYYFGANCDKFCRPIQNGYVCNASGFLVCANLAACPDAAVVTSTTLKTTATSTPTKALTSTTTPPATTSTSTSTLTTRDRVAATTKTSPEITSSPSSKQLPDGATTRASHISAVNNGASIVDSTEKPTIWQTLNSPMHLLLMLILALVLLVGIVVPAVICSVRRRRSPRIVVSGVRFNPDDIGTEVSFSNDQNRWQSGGVHFSNQAYNLDQHSLQFRRSLQPMAFQQAHQQLQQQQLQQLDQQQQDPDLRPESGVYEEPIDIADRHLPPLPPRTEASGAAAGGVGRRM